MPPKPQHGMTSLRRRMLRMFADGDTTEEAAKKLHLSVRSVKYHLAALNDQYGTRNRTHLVAELIRMGEL